MRKPIYRYKATEQATYIVTPDNPYIYDVVCKGKLKDIEKHFNINCYGIIDHIKEELEKHELYLYREVYHIRNKYTGVRLVSDIHEAIVNEISRLFKFEPEEIDYTDLETIAESIKNSDYELYKEYELE